MKGTESTAVIGVATVTLLLAAAVSWLRRRSRPPASQGIDRVRGELSLGSRA
jgi:hypothetical protein